MLRAEQRSQLHTRGLSQQPNRALSGPIQTGLVGDQAHFSTLQPIKSVAFQHIDPVEHISRWSRRWGILFARMVLK